MGDSRQINNMLSDIVFLLILYFEGFPWPSHQPPPALAPLLGLLIVLLKVDSCLPAVNTLMFNLNKFNKSLFHGLVVRTWPILCKSTFAWVAISSKNGHGYISNMQNFSYKNHPIVIAFIRRTLALIIANHPEQLNIMSHSVSSTLLILSNKKLEPCCKSVNILRDVVKWWHFTKMIRPWKNTHDRSSAPAQLSPSN